MTFTHGRLSAGHLCTADQAQNFLCIITFMLQYIQAPEVEKIFLKIFLFRKIFSFKFFFQKRFFFSKTVSFPEKVFVFLFKKNFFKESFFFQIAVPFQYSFFLESIFV